MNVWMIVAAVLAVACIVMVILCMQMKAQIKVQRAQAVDADELRREIRVIRGEDVHRRREIASLHRVLEEEQDRSDALIRELDAACEQLRSAQARAEQADARRIRTEKDVYASRMRNDLLEKQIARLHEEQINQEKLYQDILRDRDAQIARLQEGQPKRRPRRRADVLDQQVTLDELFGGI